MQENFIGCVELQYAGLALHTTLRSLILHWLIGLIDSQLLVLEYHPTSGPVSRFLGELSYSWQGAEHERKEFQRATDRDWCCSEEGNGGGSQNMKDWWYEAKMWMVQSWQIFIFQFTNHYCLLSSLPMIVSPKHQGYMKIWCQWCHCFVLLNNIGDTFVVVASVIASVGPWCCKCWCWCWFWCRCCACHYWCR